MRAFIRRHAKLLIGLLAVVLVTGAWVWFAGSARQQSSFRRTSDQMKQAESLSKKVLRSESTDQKVRLADLHELAVLKQESRCQGDWWNDWQQRVSATVSKQADECRKSAKIITSVATEANRVERYLHDEQKVITVLQSLSVDQKADKWQEAALKDAQSALKSLDGIRTTNDTKALIEAVKQRTEAIKTGWDKLNEASNKKDKTAYLSAEANLKQAYADLGSIADVSDATVTTLLTGLEKAASPL